MREHPERLAWIILLTSFLIFCSLAVGIPLGIRLHIINATDVHETTIIAIEGTIRIKEEGQELTIALAEPDIKEDCREGTTIITDATSRAFLRFFDGSRLTIYNKTQLVVLETRSPKYGLSPKPNRIALEVKGGRIRVAPRAERPLFFEITTPHAKVELGEEGSYSIEVTSEESQITVREGEANVTAIGRTVRLESGERTTVEIGRPPSGILPAERNLIKNGDFKEIFKHWRLERDRDDPEEPLGEAEVIIIGGRRAMHFSRYGENGENKYRGDVAIKQIIEKDVRDCTSLELRMTVLVHHQNVSGGGMRSSEFPVMARLDYKDIYGGVRHYVWGFYYENPAGHPINVEAYKIHRDRWYPFESGNLMKKLPGEPAYIISLKIYASGHDYESMVSEVELLAEE